jgi:hypothetical protein
VSFHATTSGHGTNMQYGKIKNALNINLGNFKSVSIDTANNRLTIGGATSFGDVFGPLWAAGKEVRKCAPILLTVQRGGRSLTRKANTRDRQQRVRRHGWCHHRRRHWQHAGPARAHG